MINTKIIINGKIKSKKALIGDKVYMENKKEIDKALAPQQMTSEIAVNNLASLLGSNELKLNKNDHIVLEQSLVFLSNTAKEVEILRNRVKDLELVKKKK